MITKKKYNFITPTLKFCIAGFFITGFTAAAIVGLQIGIGLLGIECSNSWTILWTLTAIGALIAPFVFVRLMYKTLLEGYNMSIRNLIVYNIIEYTFIQCALATLFTTGHTLCYVTDGQNGLELVFTGWMAMPCLIVFSILFDNLREQRTDELKTGKIPTE